MVAGLIVDGRARRFSTFGVLMVEFCCFKCSIEKIARFEFKFFQNLSFLIDFHEFLAI